jgi:hypothetical protein
VIFAGAVRVRRARGGRWLAFEGEGDRARRAEMTATRLAIGIGETLEIRS